MTINDMIQDLPWYKKLELLRTAKGWTQDEAAERCYTGKKVYWLWENGRTKPRNNSRRAIASAFEVEEKDLFGGK